MHQTESLHVAIHAAKKVQNRTAEVGESVNMTPEFPFTQTTRPKSKISTGKREQLIELFLEHPHLYNPRLPEHMYAQLIHDTWGRSILGV